MKEREKEDLHVFGLIGRLRFFLFFVLLQTQRYTSEAVIIKNERNSKMVQ